MASNLTKMIGYIVRAHTNLECIKTCPDMLFGSTQDCSMVGVVAPHFFKLHHLVLLSSAKRRRGHGKVSQKERSRTRMETSWDGKGKVGLFY
jgi:hypothetical protein